MNDYELELTFENNETKIFDVKPYLDTGVFKKLKDRNYFKMVKVSFDTIEWPNGIDLDPEVLYEKSKINCLRRRTPCNDYFAVSDTDVSADTSVSAESSKKLD